MELIKQILVRHFLPHMQQALWLVRKSGTCSCHPLWPWEVALNPVWPINSMFHTCNHKSTHTLNITTMADLQWVFCRLRSICHIYSVSHCSGLNPHGFIFQIASFSSLFSLSSEIFVLNYFEERNPLLPLGFFIIHNEQSVKPTCECVLYLCFVSCANE